MKNVITLLFLVFILGLSSVKSQSSSNKNNISLTDEKPTQLSLINNICFTTSNTTLKPVQSSFSKIKQSAALVIHAESFTSGVIKKFNSTCLKYAMVMGVNVESLTNLALYDFIKEWFGTRYRFGGKTKRGIDCSAFTGTLLSAVYTLIVPRTARLQYKSCEHISKEDLLEGDLVFFNTRGGVSHVGVYLTNGHFVHSSSSRGVMISNLDDQYFSRRFIGGGRIN